jgi:exopolyphosphatase/guanosine-5'-triphosphate,3'-diphosphate pyrophosphatase
MIVMKLASILRLADSLDNSGLQLVESIKITRENESINVNLFTQSHIFAESYSFKYKKDLFEECLGIAVKMNITRKSDD